MIYKLQINSYLFELFLQVCEVMYRAVQSSELRFHIKRVRDFQIVFCLQIHAIAGHAMNSTLPILHSASPRAVLVIFLLSDKRVRLFVIKTLTLASNP